MISSASPHQRMILGTLLAGAVVLAALWMLAISPKRSESAEVRDNVATQEQRLDAAKAQVAAFEATRKSYPRNLRALGRLDKAVPARGEISTLLRQLQKRANVRNSALRLAALKPAANTGATPAISGGTTPSSAAAPATSTLTPGATVGTGGVATLPFTFTYTGKYFDLVNVLKAARRSVSVRSGHLKIDGRLVTIEGVSFERPEVGSDLITAAVSGTAYIAAAPVTPPAAAPAATTPGGS
jgi:hypothetical protein